MSNHPNRGRGATPITPEMIRAAREALGLTQKQAGELIHCTLRTWQDWEYGSRRIHPAMWELFQIKAAALA